VDQEFFKKLHAEGTISDESYSKIEQRNTAALVSLHLEVRTFLYLGIVLLTTGLGIVVYKNINTIGHQAILAFIALITIGCFFYCYKHKKPFSKAKVQTPNSAFDYLLLLGTLSFLIFVGYLQYQYNVFGSNYGLATFIPMLVLFYIAYDFDHMGILNLGITNLGIWMGVSVTPKQLLFSHTFNSTTIIYTYLGFGLLLLFSGWLTGKLQIKPHFKFSYQHYGLHVSLISLLAGYFFLYDSPFALLWLAGVFILSFLIYRDAVKQHSFYFILSVILYSYVAITSLIFRGLGNLGNDGALSIYFLYFIASPICLILLLININKKLKKA
jgi:hypothetical protein